MPKAITAAEDPNFEPDIVVPAPGDGASSQVIELAVQRLLDNTAFVKLAAETLGQGLTTHLANTSPHQATAAATASRLVLRDAEGRAKFGAPADPTDAARLADIGGAINGLPAVLRDPSAWEGLAGALLAVNDEEDGLEAVKLSVSQLNELLKREIAITVSNSGDVDNLPGRLPITASIVGAGRFVLTCPAGWVWHTAVGSGNNSTELRSITANGAGTRELNASVFNASGTLQTVSFYLVGTLREAQP